MLLIAAEARDLRYGLINSYKVMTIHKSKRVKK